jgi:hypothetical protein
MRGGLFRPLKRERELMFVRSTNDLDSYLKWRVFLLRWGWWMMEEDTILCPFLNPTVASDPFLIYPTQGLWKPAEQGLCNFLFLIYKSVDLVYISATLYIQNAISSILNITFTTTKDNITKTVLGANYSHIQPTRQLNVAGI